MKKIKWYIILAGVLFVNLLLGCSPKTTDDEPESTTVKEFYTLEDFQSLTLGKSTLQDISKIACADTIQTTSYGGVCEFPTEKGGYIYIKLYGKDMVVFAIEETVVMVDKGNEEGKTSTP